MRFVDLSLTFSVTSEECRQVYTAHEYAKEVLGLGLLLFELNDAVREGDAEQIIRCWRFFFPLFRASNKTNYILEAFTSLAQEN